MSEKKPKHNKKLSLHPLSFEEALTKILKAGPHPKAEKPEPPSKPAKPQKSAPTSTSS